MFHRSTRPDQVLSTGRHRSARTGACLMEMTSHVAGERWSDHPECTHPLIGYLARLVNDHMSDARRDELTRLIPDLVGLTSEDRRWYPEIACAVASAAILDIPEPRQRALAVGLAHTERVAEQLGLGADLRSYVRIALDQVPAVAGWARAHDTTTVSVEDFCERTAPAMVRCCVEGMAVAAVSDTDGRLEDLLEAGVAAARAAALRAPAAVPRQRVG